jgi:hypothetical protein
MRYARTKTALARRLHAIGMASLLLVGGAGLFLSGGLIFAQGATINDRGILLSDSRPGVPATYRIFFTAPGVPQLGSVKIEFCENSPLFDESCTAPVGFNLTSAVLAAQSGETGFSIHPDSSASVLILSRTPAASTGLPTVYELTGVTNATAGGSQYARFTTHQEDDASGAPLDRGGIAYSLNEDFQVTTEVPPNIEFCVGTSIPVANCAAATGNYLQLGEFSPQAPTFGRTQMAAATNAANGYSISVTGRTMVSGTNAIPALTTPTPSAPGTSQFGINLAVNSAPASGIAPFGPGAGNASSPYNIPNRFLFRPGDILASHNTPDDYRVYTINYLINISEGQPAGVYAGTFTYVALGNF